MSNQNDPKEEERDPEKTSLEDYALYNDRIYEDMMPQDKERGHRINGDTLNGSNQDYWAYSSVKREALLWGVDVPKTRNREKFDKIVPVNGKEVSIYEKVWPIFERLTGVDPHYRSRYLHYITDNGYLRNRKWENIIPFRALKKTPTKKVMEELNNNPQQYNALVKLCVLFLYWNQDEIKKKKFNQLRMSINRSLGIHVTKDILQKVGKALEKRKQSNAPIFKEHYVGTDESADSKIINKLKKRPSSLKKEPKEVKPNIKKINNKLKRRAKPPEIVPKIKICPECTYKHFNFDKIHKEISCIGCGIIIDTQPPYYVDGVKITLPEPNPPQENKEIVNNDYCVDNRIEIAI